MRYPGREDDGLPRGHVVFLPVEHGEDRIEGCGVLREPLAGIEGEEGDVSRRVGDDHPGGDRSLVVFDQVFQPEDGALQFVAVCVSHVIPDGQRLS